MLIFSFQNMVFFIYKVYTIIESSVISKFTRHEMFAGSNYFFNLIFEEKKSTSVIFCCACFNCIVSDAKLRFASVLE